MRNEADDAFMSGILKKSACKGGSWAGGMRTQKPRYRRQPS